MTLVVKIGGGAGIDPLPLVRDLAARRDWVLVHGASDEATRLGEALGHPPRFVTSVSGHASRFTDARTLEHVAMAAGKVNLRLVEALQRAGVNAGGLLGPSGRVLEARRKDHVRALVDGKQVVLRGDFTGTVERVHTALLRTLLAEGYAPVVGPLALSEGREVVNVDGDRAAAALAAALGAEALVILTNVPGLLRDVHDPATLVRHLAAPDLEDAAERYAQGRFKKKVLGAAEALRGGVPRVVLASAAAERPLEAALRGEGTVIEGPGLAPTEAPA